MVTFQRFLNISTATEKLCRGMYAQLQRPLPIDQIKRDPDVGRDGSINWGPWNEKAAAIIRQAAIAGSLPIYFVPRRRREEAASTAAEKPNLVPAAALKLVIPSRQGLPDHPTRLIRPEASNGELSEWRWNLAGSKLLIETTAFENWYRAEKQKGKWPSQLKRLAPKPGRPRVADVWVSRILNLIDGKLWCARQPISHLKELLRQKPIVIALSEAPPSDDSLARIVDDIFEKTGDSRFFRLRRRSCRKTRQRLPLV